MVLLDAKQDFDCIWINGLFYQLYKSGLDYVLWKILRSYYTGFYCTVRVAGIVSEWFEIKQGVLQVGGRTGVFSQTISCIY